MRDEDLKNLPQTIERWKFAEMLEALGLGRDAQNNLRGFVVGVEGIKAVVYATDENGRKYFVRQMDHVEAVDLAEADPQLIEGDFAQEVAMHEISIPFVGEWKRPADLGVGVLCQSWQVTTDTGHRMLCGRYEGHVGEHTFTRDAGPVPVAEFVPCGTTDGHGRTCVLEHKHGGVHDFGPRRVAACGAVVPHGYHNWLEGINAKECSGLED